MELRIVTGMLSWMIRVDLMQPEAGESAQSDVIRERLDQLLLALKKEGATSQGMQLASRNWTRQEQILS